MPRFVILLHAVPDDYPRPSHWDLMLEHNDALLTWAIANEPTYEREIAAERLPDHRLPYLDYEGPISGDRGHVSRFDIGKFEFLHPTRRKNLETEFEFYLHGEIIEGHASLSKNADSTWTFRIERK